MKSGFILIDKPAGITSHDVIDRMRKITGIKKIGHAGTLDPFATGLLIVAIGRESTKQISQFVKMDKSYTATFILGATTDTLDTEGTLILDQKENIKKITPSQIKQAMTQFIGKIEQIPPMYSAIKVNGKKMYELARAGKTIQREPRTVTITDFTLTDTPQIIDNLFELQVKISCGSGTYVRALARDLALKLNTLGYTKKLRRTRIGDFYIEKSTVLDEITPKNWTSLLFNANLSV